MITNSVSTTAATSEDAAHAAVSWLPLIILVLAQLQMGFNINALPVSIGPVSEDLNAPPTAIGTALVVYSLFVAAFVMLGIILSIRKIFSIPAPNLPAYNKKNPSVFAPGFFRENQAGFVSAAASDQKSTCHLAPAYHWLPWSEPFTPSM